MSVPAGNALKKEEEAWLRGESLLLSPRSRVWGGGFNGIQRRCEPRLSDQVDRTEEPSESPGGGQRQESQEDEGPLGVRLELGVRMTA